jgi:hypothetical protein
MMFNSALGGPGCVAHGIGRCTVLSIQRTDRALPTRAGSSGRAGRGRLGRRCRAPETVVRWAIPMCGSGVKCDLSAARAAYRVAMWVEAACRVMWIG